MDILVIGTGYVGLVTGVCFAEVGHNVVCLDIDEEKIEKLNQGIVSIYEPGLQKLTKKNLNSGNLTFTTDYKKATEQTEVAFICVPTPSQDDGSANLEYLNKALDSFAEALDGYKLIIIKSTVPPGTSKHVETHLQNKLNSIGKGYEFDVVSNPEFLREGCAIHDCMNPDRIIVGCEKASIKTVIHNLYRPFGIKDDNILFMDHCSSEMTKYAANAMLATRISFMNELSGLCEKLGANIESIRKGIGSDSRIGSQFLYAGAGFGGSCFPKDIRALRAKAKHSNYKTPMLDAVEATNENQKKLIAKKIHSYFEKNGGVKGKTIAVWGISFKPNTDDIREAPSLDLIHELEAQGAVLRVYDPAAMDNAKSHLGSLRSITFCQDEYHAAEGADAIALITEWNHFKVTNLDEILSKMKGNALFDGRNQFCTNEMSKKGFNYFAIGIPKITI
ncbi:UDP-glucose 6-dehydrogenase [Candidatus Aerophobetes bacterium]|uniref:UDP-glucose 6-dehydrogenase n=1 Tax=Aerophobetes bacterium TaxID=2030807 RepID=A0A2A4YCC5_UNCAE|nr:MAG: UDP-glucose 6-dehydrogenase [Candidatus Aerophobetes bacterium]